MGQEANGTACVADEQCLSGQCVDGFCCELPCGGLCVACAGLFTGEQDGACEPITAGTDPNGECQGALACDGAGSCS